MDFFTGKKDLFPNNEDSSDKQKKIIRSWEEKVGRFLFFCVDGGICGDLFNIEFIFRIIKYNKRVETEFLEVLLQILLNIFEGENIRNYISDMNYMKKNNFNEIFLYKIIKYYGIQNFFKFDEPKLENEFINYLVEEKWTYELLEAIYVYLSSYKENNNDLEIREHFKKFSEIKKGLVTIYQNETLIPKVNVITCKILTILCTYDDSGSSVESLINLDIISIIAKKISTYDYSLLQLNFLFLYVITDRIKGLKLIQMVAHDKLIFDAISNVIVDAKYYDNPDFIFDNLIKVLFNLIASDMSTIQEKKKKSKNMDKNVAVEESCIQKRIFDQIKSRPENNIPYNLLIEFVIQKVKFRENFKGFVRHCKIEEKVYRFFSCLIMSNFEMKEFFIHKLNFLKIISEGGIIREIIQVYHYFSSVFMHNKKMKSNQKIHADTTILSDFPEVLRVIYRLFQFVFFLYEKNKNELQDIINKEDYMKDFLQLFETINQEKDDEGIIKNILANDNNEKTFAIEFHDFSSSLFSLHTLLIKEDDI